MTYVEENWMRPDNGIWEIRGPQRHFTHSRVMVWAAFDCAIRAVREFGLEGPAERWQEIRDEIRDEIEQRDVHGYSGIGGGAGCRRGIVGQRTARGSNIRARKGPGS